MSVRAIRSRRLLLAAWQSTVTEPVLTGERTWPDVPRENYWFTRHLACYRWSAEMIGSLVSGGPLLDAGSGEGYGAAELATACTSDVVAVELDALTTRHSGDRYSHVGHVQANLVSLPFHSKAFASTVSLQVIEHIWDPHTYLRELARCTRGPVIISTPNRPVHSPHLARGERPGNPFHVREFDAAELVELLTEAFPDRSPVLYGLSHAQRIATWERENGSLPLTLLEYPESAEVVAFAQTVTCRDFAFEPLDGLAPGPDAQDLVAIW